MFAQNNKAWSMILVPRSRTYEGFCVSAKKTKWVRALVDSIVPPAKLMYVNEMADQESNFSNIYMEGEDTKRCSSRQDAIK